MKNVVFVESRSGFVPPLSELMKALPFEVHSAQWRLYSIYGVGQTAFGGMLKLVSEIDESTSGKSLTWEELQQLSEDVDDLYDLTVFGFIESIPAAITNRLVATKALVALRLHDSSFWQCYFRDTQSATEFAETLSTTVGSETVLPWVDE